MTRWPVAGVAGAVAGWWTPEVLGARGGRERAVAKTEAIAGWTEMLRDTMAGAHGLEEAITTTAAVAPTAIRPEVVRLAARTEQMPLSDALVALATELAHPTADLVVAALRLAAGGAARDLGELLGSLATAARDEAGMRLRVEAARARLRTAVRVIAATSIGMVVGLVVLNPSYVKVYGSPLGQAVLALISLGWGGALWWLAKMSRFAAPGAILGSCDGRDEMTAAVIIGVGFGTGLALIVTGLRPATVPLTVALEQLHRPRARRFELDGAVPTRTTRLLGESWAGTSLARRVVTAAEPDLHVVGTTAAEHLAQRVACALVALLWAPATTALMAAGGVDAGWVLPAWVSIALAPLGFLLPGIALRTRANERRRSFRHAFSSFLDIVSVSLAGGQGVDGALHAGAEAGQGWAFAELRRALMEARLLGEPPWAGLGRLGGELGIAELTELAASASLAGAEGARVRASISAKAKALRLRGLTDIEAAAQSASERMSLPIVALLVFFVVFLGYPAVTQVLRGL